VLQINQGYLRILLLLVIIIFGILFTNACIKTGKNTVITERQNQIIKNISPEEAYKLILENKDNPDFVIIDVRTPEEFSDEHLKKAINLNYYSDTFQKDLHKLDKNKTYLIYCRTGGRSGNTLNIMQELDFRVIYWVELLSGNQLDYRLQVAINKNRYQRD